MTKKYIMIGAPITKVRTPPMLEAYLQQHGCPATVEARHVAPEDLPAVMKEATADASIAGFMVTMPHKKAVIPYLAHVSQAAQQVGSVNAIKRLKSGQWAGAQFDGAGLVNAVLGKNIPLSQAHVLLAGVGGAGMAIAQALAAHGCASLTLVEPDAQRLKGAFHMVRQELGFAALQTQISPQVSYDLLINATPLGMQEDDPSPFTVELVAKATWVADIVADPPETRLAAMAIDAGCTLVTGREMVRGQVEPIGDWLLGGDIEQ